MRRRSAGECGSSLSAWNLQCSGIENAETFSVPYHRHGIADGTDEATLAAVVEREQHPAAVGPAADEAAAVEAVVGDGFGGRDVERPQQATGGRGPDPAGRAGGPAVGRGVLGQ